ncbi:Pex5p NDAI_0C05130 [Naumovozyma dairenensis CBS 421]|uniref:Uncharacterized protein n=1 Tax=Naumovozyma dairenensis (strain ATCC 10597 / BCRC 20456 / CBS 421 / NBRC 0211 / NRRL Y-12639) TaxID=1071378 RepID=G0W8R1_NAUDC|nr:hypothetical protein NDAI_0C05130 [Naumovozyma dairenensis CBS 421]CCD24172.1 hypothetical protein NDAI_0C05130 [Naumovozyma dairenensis CBS 421]
MTECSVNNNPLARLNNVTQKDNASIANTNLLQGGDRYNNSRYLQQDQQRGPVFDTGQTHVSDTSKQHINNFFHGSSNALPNQNGQHLSPLNLTPNTIMMTHGNTLNTTSPQYNILTNNSAWSNEFQNSSKNSRVTADKPSVLSSSSSSFRPQLQPSSQLVNNFGPTSSSRFLNNNSINQPFLSHPPAHQQKQKQYQQENTNWDQQFHDLETEISKNLNIAKDDIDHQQNSTIDENVNDDDINQYQSEFQKVWDTLHEENENLIPSISQMNTNNFTTSMNYQFSTDTTESKNQYLHNPNAYEIGCILMENGAKLSDAAMAFEAAIKQDMNHVQAWLKLGLVQIQNEKELNGIAALESCINLDPNNLLAMENLAISYINEGYDISAYNMLNKWLDIKYPENAANDDSTLINEELKDNKNRNLNDLILKKFLKIGQINNNANDAEFQLCLGLLHYSNDDFDKTLECFQNALKINPNDELMWNRLGASLANSNRSEEAIKAYHKAINLKPSFVRARYNLAVASMNIGCYQEAAGHLLTVLKMHQVHGQDNTSVKTDTAVLETLKRVLIAMDRNDLLDKVYPGMDLSPFSKEFAF